MQTGVQTSEKTESLRYSLAFSHNSYSYPLILLVPYMQSVCTCSGQCTCSAHALYMGVGVPRCDARVRSVGRRRRCLTPSLRLRHRCPEDHRRRAAAGRCHLLLERLSQQVDVGRLHPDLCCGRSRHAQCRGARRQQWPTHPQRWNAQVKREHHRLVGFLPVAGQKAVAKRESCFTHQNRTL